MRELKFRVWEPQYKMMSPVTHMDFVTQELDCQHNMGEPKMMYHFDVMQFLGVQDKNGQDVYQGDIVKCTSGCPHVVEWYDDNGGTFFGGMPGFNLSGLIRNGGKGYAWTGEEEIIGNIHENPELLR